MGCMRNDPMRSWFLMWESGAMERGVITAAQLTNHHWLCTKLHLFRPIKMDGLNKTFFRYSFFRPFWLLELIVHICVVLCWRQSSMLCFFFLKVFHIGSADSFDLKVNEWYEKQISSSYHMQPARFIKKEIALIPLFFAWVWIYDETKCVGWMHSIKSHRLVLMVLLNDGCINVKIGTNERLLRCVVVWGFGLIIRWVTPNIWIVEMGPDEGQLLRWFEMVWMDHRWPINWRSDLINWSVKTAEMMWGPTKITI